MNCFAIGILISHHYSNFRILCLEKPITVAELCGGDLADLSSLELLKREDLQFQVVDEADLDDDDIEILDELGELDVDDDDDDGYYL